MKFDYFVLPFISGLTFLLVYLFIKYAGWFMSLTKDDKSKVTRGLFSRRLFRALKEIVLESLLHRKIFMQNRLLGFMHMSLAFGWFLLIAIGNLESRVYEPAAMNLPYVPIFFKFFHANPGSFPLHDVFSFLMDLLLLLVLAGVLLALIKRLASKAYGMKKTTRLIAADRFALMALWLIFPFRLLAESLTSAVYGGGDFLTGSLGNLLGAMEPAQDLYYPAWWAYSLVLGVFFVALPFSRYMHIPTEVVLIFSRHFGLAESTKRTPLTEIEINSCSRCGICLDACQMSFAGGVQSIQSAYQLKAIRYNHIKPKDSFNCLMCGRCESVCPVGIDISSIRMITRNELNGRTPDPSFVQQSMPENRKAEVLYFAGCMSHQTPAIKKAMTSIMAEAGINYWFMDETGGLCCGRPMMLAGHHEQAAIMMEKNRHLIIESGASVLVTSCPICFKIFNKEYNLPIKVVHHTQYLLELVEEKKITLRSGNAKVVYHDPCELSRDLKVYEEPRKLLSVFSQLYQAEYEKENTLCCGNSLANFSSGNDIRMAVARDAYEKIVPESAQYLVTSCPMCKKSYEKVSGIPVRDIAEMVSRSMQRNQHHVVQQQKKVKHHSTVIG
ncbi:MAG TPA: (Fe-S)-binding protein [Bacteroidales bacterium]|jgi:Fe-S oxidoreductase|nr:(Fe-S)-binding protein [Bacteroidales bacterium]